MSKRSTVTVREQPVADTPSISGALKIHAETITIDTEERVEIFDLTAQVMALVSRLGIREGVVNVFSMHTTCSVFINENQTALIADIRAFLETVVDRRGTLAPQRSGVLRLRSRERRFASARDRPRPQPLAAGERRRSRARTVATHPDGRARRPARAHAARVSVMGVA